MRVGLKKEMAKKLMKQMFLQDDIKLDDPTLTGYTLAIMPKIQSATWLMEENQAIGAAGAIILRFIQNYKQHNKSNVNPSN